MEEHRPTLTMAYLPHLDYDHQRFGPTDPRSVQALREIDGVVGDLVAAADRHGAETIVVSEYGIRDVSRPVHINRALRDAGLLAARPTPKGDVLDTFASRAFAVADHQVEGLPGVAAVLDQDGKREAGLDHPNAGTLVALSDPDAWFTYYYWSDPAGEPDFARTVDIHRKPGYDPVEMFVDPDLKVPALRMARRLAQKKLGMRYLMDVIPLDASLIKGSHGLIPEDPVDGPIWLSSMPVDGDLDGSGAVPMTSVKERVLAALGR